MTDDPELLRQFIHDGSPQAFRALVERHLPLVYHVALRKTRGNRLLAEEAAQDVFIALARKAPRLAHIPSLAGWLFAATRIQAINKVRGEQRRLEREHAAYVMQQIEMDGTAMDWTRLAPFVDELLAELSENERSAILLRYYENCSYADIGRFLDLSEDAARMRTERGLDKLHQMLTRQGVSSPAVAVAGLLATHAVTAVPASLAATISAGAVAAACSGAGVSALLSLVAMNQLKMGVLGVLAVGGLAACLVELQSNRALAHTVLDVQAQNQAGAGLVDEKRRLAAQLSQLSAGSPDATELANATARLAQLKARPPAVTDAALKPAATWRNQGRATPDAALETLLWAATSGDVEALTSACVFEAKWQTLLNDWFKTLSPAAQARFGTPQRLLGAKIGAFLVAGGGAAQPNAPNGTLSAFEIYDRHSDSPGRTMLFYWEALASGQERPAIVKLEQTASGWGYDGNFRTAAEWQKFIFDAIDPTTGEWRANRPSAK